jgi:hypothetical protein
MAIRTASSRTTRTASTQSGSIAVIGDPTTDTTNDYVLTGSGASSDTVFTQLLPNANTATAITSVIAIGTPIISNVVYTDSGYNILAGNNAANLSGAYASIFGTGFQSNSNVFINGTLVSNTRVGTTRINLALPTVSVTGTYNLMVFNGASLAARSTVFYFPAPVWTSSSFTSTYGNVTFQLSATNTVSYAAITNLPIGLTFYSNGLMSGTAVASGSFTATAINQYGQVTTQTITVAIGASYTVNYLIVAGGGGGGFGVGGGGGGGGVVTGPYSVSSATPYSVVVGGGGASSSPTPNSGPPFPGNTFPGGNGQNSTVFGYTAVGGGGGHSIITWQPSPTTQVFNVPFFGNAGGSGGGGAYLNNTPSPVGQPGGPGTQPAQSNPGATQYGNPGGIGGYNTNQSGGGGGGAGEAGYDSAGGPRQHPTFVGRGGDGISLSITGSPVFYAGGGGAFNTTPTGAIGGLGGGGRGGTTQVAYPSLPVGNGGPLGYGLTNTGGGGGASSVAPLPNQTGSSYNGGQGGSGIGIITYPSVPGAQIGTGGTITTYGSGPTLTYVHTFTSSNNYVSTTTPTWVTSTALSSQKSGTPFSIQLSATDINTVTYLTAIGNSLPSGTTLTGNGVFSGTIGTLGTSGVGSYSFYVNAVNVIGAVATRRFTLAVAVTSPTWVTPNTLANVDIGTAFSRTLTATDITSITYSVAAGNTLPAGTALDSSTGVFSGTINTIGTGTYSFYIDATNTIGSVTNRLFTFAVGYTVNYLIVAGGGGGSASGPYGAGGGGGAGGLQAASLRLRSGVPYTITVGAGGTGGLSTQQAGTSGNIGSISSIQSTSPLAPITVTSSGGGRSGSYVAPSGGPGGSGGGTAGSFSPIAGTAGPGTPGQGSPGGTSVAGTPGTIGGGSGGGGSGSGGSGGGPTTTGAGGAGGAGSTWPFTNTVYAGGGGGGGTCFIGSTPPVGGVGGAGGAGGGGPGSNGGTNAGSAPTPFFNTPVTTNFGQVNRGGGAGGSGWFAYGTSGNGGSGIVAIAVPTPQYSATYAGSNVAVTTPPAAPGQTVITWYDSGTYTA